MRSFYYFVALLVVLTFCEGAIKFPATAAFQVEGAWLEDGRGMSIWDSFCHLSEKCKTTGDVTDDFYHMYESDIGIMKRMNLKYFRISISWSRIFPSGQESEPNQKGIDFYNNLIDALLEAGIQPIVTLYHWDLPLALQTELDGWLNKDTIQHFVNYAELCFSEFGDRVKYWITFNEPLSFVVGGFTDGTSAAPGRSLHADTEPYIVGHNVLLAHGETVKLYREKYETTQGGQITMTCVSSWYEPKDPKKQADVDAAERGLEFTLGWYFDPIIKGDYPEIMKTVLGSRLPKFTEDEKKMLRGSLDFIGFNHYSTNLAEPATSDELGNYWNDVGVYTSADPSWNVTDMGWPIVPWGIRKNLAWIAKRYSDDSGNQIPILITENGCAVKEGLHDEDRIQFLTDYLTNVWDAINKDGVNVVGYHVWSLLDNFEWTYGTTKKFGLVQVDYDDPNLKRTMRDSAYWYANVTVNNGF